MMSILCKYIIVAVMPFAMLMACSNTSSRDQQSVPEPIVEVTDTLKADESTLPQKSAITLYLEEQGLQDIQQLDSEILVDLKYSTTDNFTKTVLYDSLYNAYLHPIAAEKLVKAQQLLKAHDSSLTLLVYDGARPMSVQKKMYAVVQNTPYHAYVANPSRTGVHNYGMAVDLTIASVDGIPLDMGTPFDFFGRAAGINREDQLIVEKVLTRKQVDNRRLLRRVMTEAGFVAIRGEWWHFNASSLNYAKENIPLIK